MYDLQLFGYTCMFCKIYRIAGKLGGRKFGEFGKSAVIGQTKTI